MKTKIYKLEEKLGLGSMKKCTPVEINAIEQVLKQGQKLPEGIYKSRSGVYYEYDNHGFDNDDKTEYVKYETVLLLRKLVVLMCVLICLTIIIAAAYIVKAFVL